jgi:hypothetical protein
MVEIKGTVVSDAITGVKLRSGDEVYDAIVNQLEGETRALFEKEFVLASGWYPLDALVQFLEADIRVSADGHEHVLIKRSEALIERQLRGVYQAFGQIATPEGVIEQISTIHRTYFRGVDIEARLAGAGRASVRYTGFEKQHRLFGLSLIGFYQKALAMAGATDINAEFATAIEDDQGFCELILTWSRG